MIKGLLRPRPQAGPGLCGYAVLQLCDPGRLPSLEGPGVGFFEAPLPGGAGGWVSSKLPSLEGPGVGIRIKKEI